MNDSVDSLALDDVVHGRTVANIALYEREPLVVREGLEIRQIASVGQRVESHDRVALMMLGPEMNEVGADESRCTRYHHPTHRDFFPRSFGFVLQVVTGRR